MPISATGNRPPSRNGFTLVELMVVLSIIGLMSAAVVFAMPDPRGTLRSDAERFAARAAAARDLAIVATRPVRLRVDAGGYGFDERRLGQWATLNGKPFGTEAWGRGIAVAAIAEVVFEPTGGLSPATQIILERDSERVTIGLADDGDVRVGN